MLTKLRIFRFANLKIRRFDRFGSNLESESVNPFDTSTNLNPNLKFSKFYESRISNPNLWKTFTRIRISNLILKFDWNTNLKIRGRIVRFAVHWKLLIVLLTQGSAGKQKSQRGKGLGNVPLRNKKGSILSNASQSRNYAPKSKNLFFCYYYA